MNRVHDGGSPRGGGLPEPATAKTPEATPVAAKRSLGLVAATCLIVGQVIGIGIFLTPAEMAKGLGAPGLVHAMWLLVGGMALAGALCYGELASRYPEMGGAYVFLRKVWGEPVAFLYGWKCLLVMDPGITAALAAGLADYVAYLGPLDAGGRKAVAVAAILLLAMVSALGTRLASGVLVLVTAVKLGVLGTIVLLGTITGNAAPSPATLFVRYPGAPLLLPALAAGFVAAFFSFGGWWEAARMAGEVRDPQRTLPRAFVLGITIVTAVYMLTSAVFMGLVPPAESDSASAFAARVGALLFGEAGGIVFAVAIIVSVLGSLAAVVLSIPRTYVALARDGLLPARFARLHPRLTTPTFAIAVQALLATVLVILGTFSDIVAYFVFVTVGFIALSVASLYRMPPPDEGSFRTPARPITPAIFVGLCVVLLVLMLAGSPRQALLGVLVVACGLPVYFVLRRSGLLRELES